jgi:hypothetical protein
MRKNVNKFYPVNDTKELKETEFKNLTKNELKKWSNFKIIQKSDFIQNELRKKQNNICPVCNKVLENDKTVIHHLNYKQLCLSSERIYVNKPTNKSPHRKIPIPDCGNCVETSNCLKKIVLIHISCHIKIHASEGRIKRKINPEAEKKRNLRKIKNDNYWKKELSKENKIIIQKSINIIRKHYPEYIFTFKYYSFYISIKPKNILVFRLKDQKLIVRIKNGNKIKINEELTKRGIVSKLCYKKKELFSITFYLTLNEFNNNLDYFKDIFIKTIELG